MSVLNKKRRKNIWWSFLHVQLQVWGQSGPWWSWSCSSEMFLCFNAPDGSTGVSQASVELEHLLKSRETTQNSGPPGLRTTPLGVVVQPPHITIKDFPVCSTVFEGMSLRSSQNTEPKEGLVFWRPWPVNTCGLCERRAHSSLCYLIQAVCAFRGHEVCLLVVYGTRRGPSSH